MRNGRDPFNELRSACRCYSRQRFDVAEDAAWCGNSSRRRRSDSSGAMRGLFRVRAFADPPDVVERLMRNLPALVLSSTCWLPNQS